MGFKTSCSTLGDILHLATQEILKAHAIGSHDKRALGMEGFYKLGQTGIHPSATALLAYRTVYEYIPSLKSLRCFTQFSLNFYSNYSANLLNFYNAAKCCSLFMFDFSWKSVSMPCKRCDSMLKRKIRSCFSREIPEAEAMPWRDKNEDFLDWARRAMRYAHAKHYPNRLKQ